MTRPVARPMKTGPLSNEEKESIQERYQKLSVEELALDLHRKPETVRKFIKHELPTRKQQDASVSLAMAVKAELRATERWKQLKDELEPDEIRLFEAEYSSLMGQFRNDVLPAEDIQIFDAIKFGILKSRILRARKTARKDLIRLSAEQARLVAKRDKEPDEIERLRDLDKLVARLRSEEAESTAEYTKLQERHDALLKSLKSTRDQRIREVDNGKDTFIGFVKRLMNEEIREREGRALGLAKLAAEKEYKRLGRLHEFEGGEPDRPILSAETVLQGDEDERPGPGERSEP